MNQALASFPGVKQIVAFHGTLQHGITPSVFQLTIAPQATPVKMDGDLTLTFGGTKIVLKDCCINSASYQFDEGGFLVGLNIFDRRWKWRYGHISGRYNVTDDAGEVLDGTGANDAVAAVKNSERTPKQLAKKLLEAMGEQGYSIADMPDDTRPRCEWDFANPAKALQDMLDSLGCRLVLGLDNKVRVRKLGVGKDLPNLPFVDAQLDLDPPEKPDRVKIVTAPVQVQIDWELEAVGLDTDGEWKLLDDLSFKPAAGWANVDPDYFAELAANSDPTVRNLAGETVYRCYRPVLPKDIAVIGNDGKIEQIPLKKLEQIEFLPQQVDRDDIAGEKKKVRREAWCYGIWFVPDPKDWMTTTEPGGNSANTEEYITTKKNARLVTVGFSIDTQLRIVRFAEQVYKQPEDFVSGSIAAATLRLRTCCYVRKADTGELCRATFSKATPGQKRKTKDMIEIRDDLEPTLVQTYTNAFAKDKTETNIDDIKPGALAYAAHLIRELGIESPASKKYPGLHAIELDGALQAITWEIGARGGFTTVQRNQDNGSRTCDPYAITRQQERRKSFEDGAKKVLDVVKTGIAFITKLLPVSK